jgi:hypothetical protein
MEEVLGKEEDTKAQRALFPYVSLKLKSDCPVT